MKESNLIIQGILDEDKIDNLFVINVKFDTKNTSEKQLFFNRIYSPIFEGKKKGFVSKLKINFSTPWDLMIRGLLILLKPQQKLM